MRMHSGYQEKSPTSVGLFSWRLGRPEPAASTSPSLCEGQGSDAKKLQAEACFDANFCVLFKATVLFPLPSLNN
jgi:hypothetical protein